MAITNAKRSTATRGASEGISPARSPRPPIGHSA
jgi:hypothetical protein